jgi:hypothetical protein
MILAMHFRAFGTGRVAQPSWRGEVTGDDKGKGPVYRCQRGRDEHKGHYRGEFLFIVDLNGRDLAMLEAINLPRRSLNEIKSPHLMDLVHFRSYPEHAASTP